MIEWFVPYLVVGAVVILILHHLDPERDALIAMHPLTVAISFAISWLLWPISLIYFFYHCRPRD